MVTPCVTCRSDENLFLGFLNPKQLACADAEEFIICCHGCATPGGDARFLVGVKTPNRVWSKNAAIAAWNRMMIDAA